ncbi:uncharacterized protein LOC126882962 isoform X2 [Diabrotica virgifera virgifera]|uniref:Chymotrypsin inhibitor-like n=1 Tax=Diabrotica virgifera virgifera TaxID=50390 RepID=A0ABM5K1D8_DIAVI|nr:uncharacterized protein LOC126882962 isoform X2 [Diabrotica virgifera virgifera]
MKTVFVAIFMVMVVASVAGRSPFVLECGENEVDGCEPCCPQSEVTCQNKVSQPCDGDCPFICIMKCVCAKGYLRDTKSGKCVTDC